MSVKKQHYLLALGGSILEAGHVMSKQTGSGGLSLRSAPGQQCGLGEVTLPFSKQKYYLSHITAVGFNDIIHGKCLLQHLAHNKISVNISYHYSNKLSVSSLLLRPDFQSPSSFLLLEYCPGWKFPHSVITPHSLIPN